MKRALVLCSGGMDSCVLAYHLKKQGHSLHLLFFDYGQNGVNQELACVRYHARILKSKVHIVKLQAIGSSLIHSKQSFKPITKEMLKDTRSVSNQWYVPCRNLIFLSHGLSIAESEFGDKKPQMDLFVGFGSEGNDCYPDASKRFINLFNRTGKFISGKKVFAPFINKDKEDIVTRGLELGVNLKKTWSCYSNAKKHCGLCLACALRKQGFYWANTVDPTDYLA